VEIIQNLKYISFSNWLLIIGPLVLVFAGLVVLQGRARSRSRHLEAQKAPPKWLVVARLTAFGVFTLLLVTCGLMLFYTATTAIQDARLAPSQVEIPPDLPFAVQEVHFSSPDGPRLAGWYVPPENGAIIILVHGYGGNRLSNRWYAERLTAAGYGVLMYDERASGESEGEYRSFGWEDAADVGAAVAFLEGRPEADLGKIGIAGCSIGGQIALQGGAYYPAIGAVWADGASIIRYADIAPVDNLVAWIAKISNIPLDWLFQWVVGIKAPPAMIEIIGNIAPRPVMLVAGGKATSRLGSEAPQAEYFAAYAGENAQVWVIPEAVHCDGPKRDPVGYEARLLDFFDTALGIKRPE